MGEYKPSDDRLLKHCGIFYETGIAWHQQDLARDPVHAAQKTILSPKDAAKYDALVPAAVVGVGLLVSILFSI